MTPEREASVWEARLALAEERARAAERRLWNMSGEIQEVYLEFCRRDLRLVYVSRSFEELFGRSLAEVCNDTEAFLSSFGKRQRDRVLEMLKCSEPVDWQRFLISTPDESVRAVRWRMTPCPGDPDLVRGVIVRIPRGAALVQPDSPAAVHEGPGSERRKAS